MAARHVLNLIKGLYQRSMDQQKVTESREESVQFLHEANTFVDVERLTGVAMHEEAQQLATARSTLDNLHTQLREAIASWNRVTPSAKCDKELPWPQFPGPPPASPQPTSEQQVVEHKNHGRFRPLKLTDPAIGTTARYTQQWESWLQAPKIDCPSATLSLSRSTPWWMQERDHYGLLQPLEQDQLEDSARAARLSRTCTPAPQRQSFAREVRRAHQQQQQQKQQQLVHPTLPLLPVPESGASHPDRGARSCSADIWLDEDFDPYFWQKHLRPGNVWTNPSRQRLSEEDNISPRTRSHSVVGAGLGYAQPGVAPMTASEGAYLGKRATQVDGARLTPNYPQARTKKTDFRSLVTRTSSSYHTAHQSTVITI